MNLALCKTITSSIIPSHQFTKIESNIQNNGYNLDAASNYSAKGLPVLDYLLFHTSQSELLIELMDEARVTYMKDCFDMMSRVAYVVNGWDVYRNVFVDSEGNDQNSSRVYFLIISYMIM